MIIQETTSGGVLPPKKVQNAVCVAVIDVGESYGIPPDQHGRRMVPSKNPQYPDAKQQIRFIFESEEKMEDGRPFQLTHQVNVTYDRERGKLLPFLDGWGIELLRNAAGKIEMDMEACCVGKSAMLNVVHEPSKRNPDQIWANISTAMPSEVDLKPSGEFNKSEYLKKAAEKYAER